MFTKHLKRLTLLSHSTKLLRAPFPFIPHAYKNFSSHQNPSSPSKIHSLFKDDPSMKLSDYENILNNLRASKTSSQEDSIEILRVLYKLASTSFNQNDSQKALKYYAEALALGEKANLTDTLEIACVNNSLGNAYLRQNELDDALKHLQKASEIFQKHADNPEVKSQIVENTYLQAMAYDKKKQSAKAIELYQKALQDSHALEKNEAASALVIVYDRLGNLEFDKGPDYWKKGLEVALANFGKDSIEAKIFYENLGWVYFHEGKFNEALEYTENALATSMKSYGAEGLGTIKHLYALGEMHSRQGDSTKGLEYFDKILGVLDKDLSADQYEKKGSSYMMVSRSYFQNENKQKAQEAFEKAVKVAIKGFGEGSLREGEYYDAWGRLLKDNILTVPDSKKALTKALSIFKKDGKDKERLSRIYSQLGEIAYYDDQFDEALEMFKECLKIAGDSDMLEEVYSYIGNIYLQKGSVEESVENHKKAIEICKKRDKMHPDLDFHYRNLGEAYDKKGDFSKAKETYQLALELAAEKYGIGDETTQRDLQLVVGELQKMNKSSEIESLQKKYQPV